MSGVSGIMMGNVPTKVLTFLGATGDTASATSYTFSGVSIGTASSDRRIIVGVHIRAVDPSVPAMTSATIGGVSATIISGTASPARNYIIVANVTTGTTADIIINIDSTSLYCYIGCYHATGLASNTPYATTLGTSPITMNCISGGFCVSASSIYAGAGTNITWTSITENYDGDFDGDRISGASFSPTVAPSVSTTYTGGGYNTSATW